MGSKIMSVIVSIIFIILVIIIIASGLFTIWLFFGMFFLGLLYVFGYLFVVNYYYFSLEQEREESVNKKKLDWCWNRVNEILRKMPEGQGLEWREGIGRRSEYTTRHDGIQNKAYRSMMGYLAKTQQLVIVIFSIDDDDIVRFYADPSPDVIEDHFHNFKPYQSGSLAPGIGGQQYGRYPYNTRRRSSRPVSIHVGNNDGFENFENFSPKVADTDKMAEDALERLKSKK